MKVLQILVWLLLLMVCYDIVNYLIFQAIEKESESDSDTRGWKHLGILGGQDLFIGDVYQWIIGGLCVLSMVLLRLVLKRPLPKSVDMWTNLHPESLEKGLDILKPRRKDSFLTCGISDTTLDTSSYIDEPAFEFPGRLSSEQLQVLLEELKFRTDEKFEGIDTWIQSNAQDSKQLLKRMERIETEMSYIRHQIFVLMSSNAKVGANLGIGDIPDNKEHLTTLRDLSDILAQVKKQFKEDEIKEVKESGDHDEENLNNNEVDEDNNECMGPGGDESNITEEHEESSDENDPTFKESKSQKKESVEKILFTDSTKSPRADYLEKPVKYQEPESEIFVNWDNKEGSFLTRNSDKDDSFTQNQIDNENGEENKDKWQFNCLDDIETEYQLQEKLNDQQSKETRKNPNAELEYICKENMSLSSAGDGNHENKKSVEAGKVEVKETITKHLTSSNESPSINTINAANGKPDINIPTRDKQVIERISLLKRSVTFAPEKRSPSPSKMLPWLPLIKKDVSPSREQEHKDYKNPIQEPVKGRRQSVSCPTVEDKRQSRRTILERELTNLERRVSPTRNKQNRRNVRSKVAEYIRGVK